MRSACFLLALFVAISAAAVEWKNLDEAHRRGGRRTSSGYLQGKVVMVCRNAEQHERMAALWESFNTKQFALIGAYAKAPEKARYPIYAEAGLASGEPDTELYITDETGRLLYMGKDSNAASQVLTSALADIVSPSDIKQWKRFLDYELDHLPAHAYNRLKNFSRAHREEAKPYRTDERVLKLVKIAEVQKVAEFLEFARLAKDARSFSESEKGKQERYEQMLTAALESPKYKGLKDRIQDERMLQEYKNAFADLKWTQAEL